MYNEIVENIKKTPKDWKLVWHATTSTTDFHEKVTEDGITTIFIDLNTMGVELYPEEFGYAFALAMSPKFAELLIAKERYIFAAMVNDAVYIKALMTEDAGNALTNVRSDIIWAVSHAQEVKDRRQYKYLTIKEDIVNHYNENILNNACYIYSAMYNVPLDLLIND